MDGANAHRADDSGFGLTEVIVSMVLLGVVALAFFPLLLRATTGAASSTTVATATRLVSQQLEELRSAPVLECPLAPTPSATVEDARGVMLRIRTTSEGCADGIAVYRVEVARLAAPAAPLATGTTLVPVTRW